MAPKHTDSDLDLVARLLKKDSAALLLLLERYHEKVYHLAYSITRSPEDAQEVAQDTFMTVWQKIKSFKQTASFSSWLYRVTSNAALMKLRSRKKEKYVLIDDTVKQNSEEAHATGDVMDPRSLPEQLLLDTELREEMYKALEQLSKLDQQVFIMRDVQGLGNDDVSDVLDLSIPAVKARLHRARQTIQDRLKKYLKENPPKPD